MSRLALVAPISTLVFVLAGCNSTNRGAADASPASADAPMAPPIDATPTPSIDATPQTTLLRVTNRCADPIWIAHSDNVADTQNVRLAHGESHDVPIPAGGLASARFWPKVGCDATGHGCKVGDNGEGGGIPCPAGGCQPPFDSKFEITFDPGQSYYDLSMVDGYTLPLRVVPKGAGANVGSCVESNCAALTLDACPAHDSFSGGLFPAFADEDLRVPDPADPTRTIACLAPCKKWNYPAPYGLGDPESQDPGLHMCCPTPIDPATGNCTVANGCMTPDACRAAADPVSVVHTSYVATVHARCPSAYSYSYDDAQGLHQCPPDTAFEVTFCP